MFSGNGVPAASDRDKGVGVQGVGVRGDSQQLRDIQDLIARLDDVNRRLALPARVMSAVRVGDGRAGDVDSVEVPSAAAG
jgi:hypothetical protein